MIMTKKYGRMEREEEEETFINKVEEAPNSGKERNLWFAIPRKIV